MQRESDKVERKDKAMNKPTPPKLELALRSLPFYGGTTPVAGGTTVPAAAPVQTPPEVNAVAEGQQQTTTEQQTQTGGGSDPTEAINQLMAQVSDLQSKLDKSTTDLKGYQDKEDQQARAAQTREQQLESDLAQREAVIQQMDTVIKNQAIVNAMQSVDGISWNSAKQAIAELNPEKFDVQVDLTNGTATATGIVEEAQRIAKEFHWLVKSGVEQDPNANGGKTPPPVKRTNSGTPPGPPGGGGEKAAKRTRLMNKYPVLSAGQPVASR